MNHFNIIVAIVPHIQVESGRVEVISSGHGHPLF